MPFKKGQSGNPAGRKKGAVSKEKREFIEILNQYGGLEERIEKLRELANGVLVMKQDEDGAKIYEKPPDTHANIYLVDRVLGKPKQAVEMDVKAEVSWEGMFGVSANDSESEE